MEIAETNVWACRGKGVRDLMFLRMHSGFVFSCVLLFYGCICIPGFIYVDLHPKIIYHV